MIADNVLSGRCSAERAQLQLMPMTDPKKSSVVFLGNSMLGGSWVVIHGVISPLIWVIATVTLLITPLITTPKPYKALENPLKEPRKEPYESHL